MTTEEAVKIVGLVSAAYPGREIPEETVMIWTAFLSDLPYVHAHNGVMNLIGSRTSDFLPSIGEIRQAVLRQCSPESELPSAGEAWAEVMGKIETVGVYRTPKWSCEAVERAALSLGWRNLCLTQNIQMDRAHFMRIYSDFRERAEREAFRMITEDNRGNLDLLKDRGQ